MSANSGRDPRCQEIFARLSEYLDGELPDDLRQAVETHICRCAPCVSFVDSLKLSIQLSHTVDAAEIASKLPPEVGEALKSAWRESMARRNRQSPSAG